MAVFYVDHENVGNSGLLGMELLHKRDEVHVFSSNHRGAYDSALHHLVKASPIKCDLNLSAVNHSNGVDFRIVAALFANINKRRKYYIVSKDGGFLEAAKMGQEMGYDIVMVDSILSYIAVNKPSALKSYNYTKNILVMAGLHPTVENVTIVNRIVNAYNGDKNRTYQMCVDNWGIWCGRDVYVEIKKNLLY